MTKREESMSEIAGLFPADSDHPNTRELGIKLLFQAIGENWRELPDKILFRYAELCMQEENKQTKEFLRRKV